MRQKEQWKVKNSDFSELEIYVHIPFCVKKCDYCDFLSGPADKKCQEAYVEALLKEIENSTGYDKCSVISVFIGGGTPTVIEEKWIGKIMGKLKERFRFSDNAEITIEANPGTLTEKKLSLYKACGINRVSIGLQSADNEELKLLGRIHTFEDFLESYRLVREAGFSNVNIDLMSAIPKQTYEKWVSNLRTVAELGPEHISAYSLIVEEGTPFFERELELPDEDTEYRMYEDTAVILKEYGYEQYEISNYARPGRACRHNIGYWKRKNYLGLGLGAASLYENMRYSNTTAMKEYLQYAKEVQKIRKDFTKLSVQEQQEEFMFLGLRMTDGISECAFEEMFGSSLPERYRKILEKYEAAGFMEYRNGHWAFSRKGIHVSNQILAEFLD